MLQTHATKWLAVAMIAVSSLGCGGGDSDRSRGNVVITPPAAPAPAEPAAVATEPAAAAEPVTAATPAAEPKPEMKAEPAPKAEVAAAPAATPPAEAPKPAAAPAATDASKGTTFKGRIVVKGDPPTINPIKPSGNDAFCIDLGEIQNDEVVIGEGNGLADVFVWVRKVPAGVEAPAPPSEPAILDQKGCRFIPPALVVQVGQPLLVKNDDATLHNTRMSGLAINFNQTVAPNNREGVPVEINRAEIVPVPVKCDIHGWMSARLLATDNPWNAISDKDGNFEIGNLPSGVELEFRLQHGIAGYVEKSLKLTLAEGEVKEQTFEVDATKLSN